MSKSNHGLQFSVINQCQPSVAFCMTSFCTKCNTWLKLVNYSRYFSASQTKN